MPTSSSIPKLEIAQDRLEELFLRQETLMTQYGLHPNQMEFMPNGSREEVATKVVYAFMREVIELGDELPWRWWHDRKNIEKARVHSELADCLHFLLELAIMFDMTPETLFAEYCAKNDENFERIRAKIDRKGQIFDAKA